MKTANAVLVAVLLGAVSASAQSASSVSGPPDIAVLQKSWRAVVRHPSLDSDPFRPNKEFTESLRAQENTDIRNAAPAGAYESREAPPQRSGRSPDFSAQLRATYVYQARIKNTGTKTIRAVAWGYIFTDPQTQEELGRYRYSNKVNIRPGQNKDLNGRTAKAPTRIVNVSNAGKELRKEPAEQVVIYRVEYADGTVWQNPIK